MTAQKRKPSFTHSRTHARAHTFAHAQPKARGPCAHSRAHKRTHTHTHTYTYTNAHTRNHSPTRGWVIATHTQVGGCHPPAYPITHPRVGHTPNSRVHTHTHPKHTASWHGQHVVLKLLHTMKIKKEHTAFRRVEGGDCWTGGVRAQISSHKKKNQHTASRRIKGSGSGVCARIAAYPPEIAVMCPFVRLKRIFNSKQSVLYGFYLACLGVSFDFLECVTAFTKETHLHIQKTHVYPKETNHHTKETSLHTKETHQPQKRMIDFWECVPAFRAEAGSGGWVREIQRALQQVRVIGLFCALIGLFCKVTGLF